MLHRLSPCAGPAVFDTTQQIMPMSHLPVEDGGAKRGGRLPLNPEVVG